MVAQAHKIICSVIFFFFFILISPASFAMQAMPIDALKGKLFGLKEKLVTVQTATTALADRLFDLKNRLRVLAGLQRQTQQPPQPPAVGAAVVAIQGIENPQDIMQHCLSHLEAMKKLLQDANLINVRFKELYGYMYIDQATAQQKKQEAEAEIVNLKKKVERVAQSAIKELNASYEALLKLATSHPHDFLTQLKQFATHIQQQLFDFYTRTITTQDGQEKIISYRQFGQDAQPWNIDSTNLNYPNYGHATALYQVVERMLVLVDDTVTEKNDGLTIDLNKLHKDFPMEQLNQTRTDLRENKDKWTQVYHDICSRLNERLYNDFPNQIKSFLYGNSILTPPPAEPGQLPPVPPYDWCNKILRFINYVINNDIIASNVIQATLDTLYSTNDDKKKFISIYFLLANKCIDEIIITRALKLIITEIGTNKEAESVGLQAEEQKYDEDCSNYEIIAKCCIYQLMNIIASGLFSKQRLEELRKFISTLKPTFPEDVFYQNSNPSKSTIAKMLLVAFIDTTNFLGEINARLLQSSTTTTIQTPAESSDITQPSEVDEQTRAEQSRKLKSLLDNLKPIIEANKSSCNILATATIEEPIRCLIDLMQERQTPSLSQADKDKILLYAHTILNHALSSVKTIEALLLNPHGFIAFCYLVDLSFMTDEIPTQEFINAQSRNADQTWISVFDKTTFLGEIPAIFNKPLFTVTLETNSINLIQLLFRCAFNLDDNLEASITTLLRLLKQKPMAIKLTLLDYSKKILLHNITKNRYSQDKKDLIKRTCEAFKQTLTQADELTSDELIKVC